MLALLPVTTPGGYIGPVLQVTPTRLVKREQVQRNTRHGNVLKCQGVKNLYPASRSINTAAKIRRRGQEAAAALEEV